MANDNSRKIERWETIQKFLSTSIAIATFWITALFWNYYFGQLELAPRLGLGAALSGVAFLHAEEIGMLIMTMMKEKWQAEGRDAREAAQDAKEEARQAKAAAREVAQDAKEEARQARAEARETKLQAQMQAREMELQLREAQAQAEVREAQAREREARAQAREAQADAREARAEAREAHAQETIRDLTRRLDALERGENSNGETA